MRADVPDPIKEFLGITQFNIQMQTGRVFLFEESDSYVAKLINDVSGISIIDDILKEANKRIRNINAEERVLLDMIEKKESQVKATKIFKSLHRRTEKISKTINILSEHKNVYDSVINSIDEIEELAEKKSKFIDTELLNSKLSLVKNKCVKMGMFRADVEKLEEYIPILEEEVVAAGILENLSARMSKVRELSLKISECVSTSSTLNSEIEEMEELKSVQRERIAELEKLNKELEEIKIETVVCPVCKKEW